MDGARAFDGASFFGRSKSFDKAPVGKATAGVADSVAAQALAATLRLLPEGTWHPSPAGAERCALRFRVRYGDGSRTSKTYTLVVNGRDESMGIDDGAAQVVVPAGAVLLHVAVRDAPFRLPVQAVYSMNADLGCTTAQEGLVLEIGAQGEGLLKPD